MFTSTYFKRSIRILKAPVGMLYLVACLIWSVKVRFNGGGQVSSFFDCQPPSLDEFLNTV